MTEATKTFSYETDGLAYTVTVYQDPETGAFQADITTTEGAMDVNAVYFGDDDTSGKSESLKGPLNMNGAGQKGDVQWDQAEKLSDPGLGPEGTEKETYLAEGETLTLELDIESLDEIDSFGIRATSTTTDEGSIKAVSEEPDPEDPQEEPTFDKVGFGVELDENGVISNGYLITDSDLPEDQDATFETYVDHYVDTVGDDSTYAISELESVVFYSLTPGEDENGDPVDIPEELFRIDAPEDGFQTSEELIAAYDAAIADGALDGAEAESDESLELMASISLPEEPEPDTPEEDDAEETEAMELL
ncbi:hypothetical protein DZK27_13330 [Rhodobacteraceae bacterium 63075]|nr:hypothetical protein DZK27_13330 [Rhodobacteraceae bacterium 63075]